jgi:hypothetical protein
MAEDVYEGIVNALNVIVSTTESSGNVKKELKTTIFDTVSILRKLFVKLLDTNESNARKITELERQVGNTNAMRGEVTGRTGNYTAEPSSAPAEMQVTNTNAFRGEVTVRTNNYIAETSSAPARVPSNQLERMVSPSGGAKAMLYSVVVEGKTILNSYKLTVTSKDNETADKIKEMLKSNINPTEIKVGIGSLKTLRDGRVQIETGSIQEAETLTNKIKDKLGDKMETNIQRLRKP